MEIFSIRAFSLYYYFIKSTDGLLQPESNWPPAEVNRYHMET